MEVDNTVNSSLSCWHCKISVADLYRELSLSPRGWVAWTGLRVFKMTYSSLWCREAIQVLHVGLVVMGITYDRLGNIVGLLVAIILVIWRILDVPLCKSKQSIIANIVDFFVWLIIFLLLFTDLVNRARKGG